MKMKFCPSCKSTNVEIKFTPLVAVGVPQNWKCNNCGYIGTIFPEREIKYKPKRKKLKKN